MGAIMMYSCYFKVGDGREVKDENARILEKMFCHVGSHGLPFLAGGDFNMKPQALQEILKQAGVHWRVVRPGRPTCTAGKEPSVIDYFVVDPRLEKVFEKGAATCYDVQDNPHRPVEVKIEENKGNEKVRVVDLGPELPIQRLVGPMPKPPSYGTITDTAKRLIEDKLMVKDGKRLVATQKEKRRDLLRENERLFEDWRQKFIDEIKPLYGAASKDANRVMAERRIIVAW